MELYVIRHAQSTNNALWARTGGEIGRSSDPELTEIGHRQAHCLAQYVAGPGTAVADNGHDLHNRGGFHFTHLYSSLMLRALTTGHYLADALAMPLQVWPEIHEWGGIYEIDHATGKRTGLPGVTRSLLAERFPRLEIPDWLGEDGWWNRPFEPREGALPRAEKFVQDLRTRFGQSDARVAIVTHGGFSYALLNVLLQFSQQHEALGESLHVWFSMNNTSISRVDFAHDYLGLAYLNRVDHLPTELIT